MAEKSNIAWTNATWNPVRGCERVSEGCRKCYAEVLAGRHSYKGGWGEGVAKMVKRPDGKMEARWTGVLKPIEHKLDEPLRWQKPQRIFVNSMSDLFHKDVPFEFVGKVFNVMQLSGWHTFQVLTKRPARMLEFARLRRAAGYPILPNVWFGVSAEDQPTFDERTEILGRIPCAVRFVSAEPFLGDIDIGNAFDGRVEGSVYQPLDWAIIGGETGSGHRPMDIAAARAFIHQVKSMGGAMFVKQDSGPRPGLKGRFTDDEWALKEYPQ